jgi:hypothetical protein
LNSFITKYNSEGNIIWAKSYGGDKEDNAYSIVADANGNVFAGGTFTSAFIVFDKDTLYNNSNNGYSDMFLTKLDSTGKVLWAKSAGDYSDERIYSLAADPSGNVYAAGEFYSQSFKLDTITLNNISVVSDDIFIAKFNASGHVLWAKSGGGSSNAGSSSMVNPTSVVADASGNALLTLCYNYAIIGIGADSIHNVGLWDGAIIKFDLNGKLLWTKDIGGSKDDGAYTATVNSFQNIFVAGFYQSPSIAFDTITLTSDQTPNYSTAYVAKLKEDHTGVINYEKRSSLFVYPNPCNGLFTVKNCDTDNETDLTVYNIFGENIFSEKHLPNIERIDISAYAKGIYFVRLTSSKASAVVKLIKE